MGIQTPSLSMDRLILTLLSCTQAEHHEQWSSVIRDARKRIKNLKTTSQSSTCHSQGLAVCHTCRSSLYTWIATIEEQPSISATKKVLSSARLSGSTSLECCVGSSAHSTRTENSLTVSRPNPFGTTSHTAPPAPPVVYSQQSLICNHIVALASSCLSQVQSIPAFNQFVEKKQNAQGMGEP